MKKTQLEKSRELKRMLNSDELSFAMECHSGLSAVIAEEAGFECLWASGLSVSAMTGCRDRNELDISEVCKVVEWMADHTNVPILVDGDTGGVDWNAARIMVNKLTKSGAAGVCIEDKLYPKHNSFLANSENDLADPFVHAGKIKAMKKENPEFVVVARLEGFISKADFEDTYRRAEIYRDAGADAILVHSKIKDSSEIDLFMNQWTSDCNTTPVVIVPTKYYTTPTDHFRDLGVSLVIWANHQMRASIKAMQDVCKTIYKEESLIPVENKIATVSEIFRLQRDNELVEEEKRYLPSYQGTAVILSAVCSKITGKPKALDIVKDGQTVLDKQLQTYSRDGITKFVLIRGEKSSEFSSQSNVDLVRNDEWSETTEVSSAFIGLLGIDSVPVYISYGDLIFKDSVLKKMSSVQDADIVIGLDPEFNTSRYNEYIYGSPRYSSLSITDEMTPDSVYLTPVHRGSDACGSFIGVIRVNTIKGLLKLKPVLQEISRKSPKARMVAVFKNLCSDPSVVLKGVYVNSSEWVDINTLEDIKRAEEI